MDSSKTFCIGVLASAFLGITQVEAAQTLSVYHVGNSVTDTIRYSGLQHLAESRGNTHKWGRSMIPGAPLSWTWQYASSTISEPPYGTFSNALPNYTWNAVTLQPFDRQLGSRSNPVSTTPGTVPLSDNDIPMVRSYVNQALQNAGNANTQFYIYSRWPRRDEVGGVYQPFDYQAKWNRTYTGGWDGTNESRDFFQKLTNEVRLAYPSMSKPVLLVPVGDVLYEIDRRMEAGQVPGYTDIVQVYQDGIHFTNVGSYIVGLTFYATIYKDDPRGMSVPADWAPTQSYDKLITPQQAAIFQDAVWSVVAGHPYSGVAVPEPAVIGTALVVSLATLARRRRAA